MVRSETSAAVSCLPRARRAAGRGGLTAVSNITGLARSTIGRGLKDLEAPPLAAGQIRREGGGPRPLTERRDATR
jgi:hypothetical protein